MCWEFLWDLLSGFVVFLVVVQLPTAGRGTLLCAFFKIATKLEEYGRKTRQIK